MSGTRPYPNLNNEQVYENLMKRDLIDFHPKIGAKWCIRDVLKDIFVNASLRIDMQEVAERMSILTSNRE